MFAGNKPSGPEGSEAQIELDISFYGVEERRKEKEGRLRGRFKSGKHTCPHFGVFRLIALHVFMRAERERMHHGIFHGRAYCSFTRAFVSCPACTGSEDITKGDEVKLSDDSKRMVLLGHLGRMRNPAPDVRRIAIQSIAKVAGPRELLRASCQMFRVV